MGEKRVSPQMEQHEIPLTITHIIRRFTGVSTSIHLPSRRRMLDQQASVVARDSGRWDCPKKVGSEGYQTS